MNLNFGSRFGKYLQLYIQQLNTFVVYVLFSVCLIGAIFFLFSYRIISKINILQAKKKFCVGIMDYSTYTILGEKHIMKTGTQIIFKFKHDSNWLLPNSLNFHLILIEEIFFMFFFLKLC